MAERRQLFAEMSKYGTFKEDPTVSIEYTCNPMTCVLLLKILNFLHKM